MNIATTNRQLLQAGVSPVVFAADAIDEWTRVCRDYRPTVLPDNASAFDRRLAEWKDAHAHFLAICAVANVPDTVVNDHCDKASVAYHALLAEPASDARDLVEKLHALTVWSKDCVIEEDEVDGLGVEAAAILQGVR